MFISQSSSAELNARVAKHSASGAESALNNGATARLPLRRPDGSMSWALLDPSDIDKVVTMGDWHEVVDGRTSYAVLFGNHACGARARLYLHRVILGASAGVHVDHINGDGLDCRRENLRELRGGENGQNRRGANSNSQSGVRGVRWHARDKRWEAALKLDRKVISLGYYQELGDAVAIVSEARRRLMPFSVEECVKPATFTPEQVDEIVSRRITKAGITPS